MGLFGGKKVKTKDLDDSLDIPPPPPIGAMDSTNPEPKFEEDSLSQPGDIPPLPDDIGNVPEMPRMPVSIKPRQQAQPHNYPSQKMPMPINSASKMNYNHVLPPEEPASPNFDIPPISSDFGDTNSSDMPQAFHESQDMHSSFDEVFQQDEPMPSYGGHNRGFIPSESGKQIFVELSNYRRILKDIDSIKRALKQSDAEVDELINDIKAEEETFSGIHSNLNEVEDKLVQLEKTLFNQ